MEHHLTVPRTARYQQLGEFSAATRQLWIVAHGYGQLAEYFIRHFELLLAADPIGTVIVAPEGLSRFYLRGTSGRVGASWMTRADRLTEIADQTTYLTQLLHQLLRQCPPATRVVVLGFSQGTATVSRWLAGHPEGYRPHQLVLWAGSFPEDIELGAARLLHELPVALVCGERDHYVSAAQVTEQAAALRQQGASVTTLTFDGGHTLNAAVLMQLHAGVTLPAL